jgi:6-phosphogluconate dehydrogenase
VEQQVGVLDPDIAGRILATESGLRAVVAQAVRAGIPVPAMASALAWLDGYRRARGFSNLIQAQRDRFGAHGYDRVDRSSHTAGDGEQP